jgi:predicted RNA-binding Zn-ribbon protein involved in translation (DUF1610 family)
MPIPVVCPACATKLRAPDHAAGRKTKCPKCGGPVAVPGQPPPGPAPEVRAVPGPSVDVEPAIGRSLNARARRVSWLLQSVRIRQTARKAFDLTRLGTGPAERLLSALILGAAFFFVVLLLAHLVGFGRGPGVSLALVASGSFMATSVVLVLWKSDAELEEQAPRLREELAVLRAAVLQARAEREAEERARAAEREAEEKARAAERAAEEELRKAEREAAEEARAVEVAALPRFCPSCATKLCPPGNAAGHKTKCPNCGEPVNIGGVTPEPPPVAKVYTPPVAAVYTPPSGEGVEVAPEPEKKACPFCGEAVLAVARKCKHCGETIDVALHAAEVGAVPAASVDVEPDYLPAPAVTCPHCGQAVAEDSGLAGQTVGCPHCGGALRMPPPVRAAPFATPAAVQFAPAQNPTPFGSLGADEDEPPSRRRRREAGSGASHSFGIASLVIGVLSFLLCWVPWLGIGVSGFGLLLGLMGLVLAAARRGSGAGFSVAGSGLSALSLAVCLVWTFALSSGFKAVDDLFAKQNRTNQTQVVDSEKVKASPGGSPFAPPGEQGEAPPKNEPEWADASKGPVQQDKVRVRVVSVTVDFVTGKDFRDFKSEEKLLKIGLQVENLHPNRKVDYRGWGASSVFLSEGAPHLTDNFDNLYKRVTFGFVSHIDGQVHSESIYPGKSVNDLLVFEVPVDTAKHLRLELPAKNFGGTGMLRLQIPKGMIRR